MDQCNLLELLGQANASETGKVFREFLQGGVRLMLADVMAAEVSLLCGSKYQPDDEAEFQRAGSAPGTVLLDGQREAVKRPRVRRKSEDSTVEVSLETYQAARQPDQLQASILRALVAGVSGREMQAVHPKSPGVSKSNVSRLWAEAGVKLVEDLRTRDIASQTWLVLMLDGIVLSKDQTAIVALGITPDGKKQILDFELGNTENYEICRDLVSRLVTRGFAPPERLLAVLDGSATLKKGVMKFFPDAVIQRCVIHKERNIRARLSRRDWGENARLFKRLREVQGEAAAREVLGEMQQFFETKNAVALASLQEAGDDLIALHKLEVPATLHRSLLSTNIIENSFRNTRRKIGRVTRFRAETDQASRWLAYALSEAEKGFRKIRGWKDLKHLVSALQRDTEAHPTDAASVGAATPLRPTACAPSPPQPKDN